MAVVVQASVKINHLIDSNVSHLVRWGSICQNSNQKQAKQNASTTFLETNDSLMRYYGVCVPFDKDSLTEEEWQSCLQKKKKNHVENKVITGYFRSRGVTGRKHICTNTHTQMC